MTSPWDPNAQNPPAGSGPVNQPGPYGHGQPGYGPGAQPAQPGYGTSSQPGYGPGAQPAQPGYGASSQPGYGPGAQPAQPGYGAPPPGYGPGQPAQGQPGYAQPGYGQPAFGQPAYGTGGAPFGGPTPPKSRAPLIIGIVIAAIVVIGGAVLLMNMLRGGTGENSADVDSPTQVRDVNLVPGNCLESMEYDADLYLTQVPCADEHGVEVFAELTVSESDHPEFPGEDVFQSESDQFCAEQYADVVQPVIDSSDLFYTSLYPTQSTWDHGDRKFSCLIAAPEGGHLTGSVIAGDARLTIEY